MPAGKFLRTSSLRFGSFHLDANVRKRADVIFTTDSLSSKLNFSGFKFIKKKIEEKKEYICIESVPVQIT
jgi:hypothetical protein